MATYPKYSTPRAQQAPLFETATVVALPQKRKAPTAPYRTNPLYRWLHNDVQDEALNGVGAYSSAVLPYREFDRLDAQSDAKLIEARNEARARGLHYVADLIDAGLHLDHQERSQVERIWHLFTGAADACRRIVRAVELLFGRGGGR